MIKLHSATWSDFMSNDINKSGYYINQYSNNGKIFFGPFKTSSIAEFFNYIAFHDPHDFIAKDVVKNDIIYYNRNQNIDKSIFLHPKYIDFENSRFSFWWQDTFGRSLSSDEVLFIAKDSNAEGYYGFMHWLTENNNYYYNMDNTIYQ